MAPPDETEKKKAIDNSILCPLFGRPKVLGPRRGALWLWLWATSSVAAVDVAVAASAASNAATAASPDKFKRWN